MLHSELSTTVSELHLDLCALQCPVLHLGGFLCRRTLSCCVWTTVAYSTCAASGLNYIHYTDLCCTRKCLWTGAWPSPGRIYTTDSCSAPGRVSSTGAWAAPECVSSVSSTGALASLGRVHTTESCAAPRRVYCLFYRGLSCTWTRLHFRCWASTARL